MSPRWDPQLELGSEELDAQHKKVFRLLSVVGQAIEAKLDKEAVLAILIDLLDYFDRHMSMEEDIMRAYDYPKLAEHHLEHESMLTELSSIVDSYKKFGHRALITVKLQTMLVRWSRDHIDTFDREMVEFLKSAKTP